MTGSNILLCQMIFLHMGFPSTQIPKKVPSLSLKIWIPQLTGNAWQALKLQSPLCGSPLPKHQVRQHAPPPPQHVECKRKTYYWWTYITSLFLLLIVILLSDLDIANWSRNNSSQHFKCKKCQVSKPQI